MTESADISKREFLPTIGACVVLTIDPIASLDQDARQDPEVLAACAKLVHKKYVGFIGNRDIFYQPGDPESFAFNVCTVEFLLQGTPKAIQDRCIEPSMSIPILPMTIADHPSSRIPLKPSNPLPWSDCYISPFWGLRVRSRSGFSEDPIDCLLDLEELAKHDRFAGKDLDRHENLCKQAGIPAETPRGPVPRTRDPLVAQERRRLAAEGAQEGIVVPIVDDDDVSSEEISTDVAFNTLFSDVASRPMITVTFSHDLSTVEGFNHPAGFFKELEDLVRIQEDARPRLAEVSARAQARAIEAAAEINAKAYDDRTVNLLAEHLTFKGRVSRVASRVKTKGRNIGRRILRLAHITSK